MGYEEIREKIEAFSRRVQDRYHPRMIVVYGSYARGTATEESDIDVAVICDTLGADYLESAAELFSLRRDIDLRIEPVLLEPDDHVSSFYNEILRTGKVVYRESA